MKTDTNTSPRIYVSTYAKYAAGSLNGAWVDLEGHDADTFAQTIRELHADETGPEFMFQDCEGFPREFYSESSILDDLWEWLALDEHDRKIWTMACEAYGYGVTFSQAQDGYSGTADSGADFAEQQAEDTGAIPKDFPDWISIDWEATWDRTLCYDYATAEDSDGTMWFFRNC